MVRTASEAKTRPGWGLAGLILLMLLMCGGAQAQVERVFTCEPEWAALVRVLAPQASVVSATHAYQDPHHIEARPALISQLRRAHLAVCTGASLEAGWLPMLQRRAGNAAVQDGRPGMFYAAQAVTLSDQRAQVDRSMGDVHAEGNPHFHLDPQRLLQVSAALAERLAVLDPAQAVDYRSRQQAWAAQWQQRMRAWEQRAAPLRGRTVVAQHATHAYLWTWLGLRQVADLEPKPGLPPTVAHLQQVLQQVQAQQPAPLAVVQALHHDPQAGRWLSQRVGLPLLALPATVTDDGPAATLEGLIDTSIDQLLAAAASAAPARP
jgi:zinc/manganese transport system substrate-binding protein